MGIWYPRYQIIPEGKNLFRSMSVAWFQRTEPVAIIGKLERRENVKTLFNLELTKTMLMHGRTERKEMTSLGHFNEGPDGGRVEKGDGR